MVASLVLRSAGADWTDLYQTSGPYKTSEHRDFYISRPKLTPNY